MRKTYGKESGFSLTELLVVVTLIAIIGAISVPMLMGQRPKWHMKGVAKDLASRLMMARLKAIQENKNHSVVISLGDIDSFTVYKQLTSSSTWTVASGSVYGTNDVNITVNSAATCISSNRVIFYPDGKALYNTTTVPTGCDDTEVLVATVAATVGSFTPVKIYVRPASGIIRVS